MYYYVYFFDFLNADNKELCTSLKNSINPDDINRYFRSKPQVSRSTFSELEDAQRFIDKMPTYIDFFALTDDKFNYLLESDECEEMRKLYATTLKPAHESIKILAISLESPKTINSFTI